MLTSTITDTKGMPLFQALHAAVNEIAERLTENIGNENENSSAIVRVEVTQEDLTATVLFAVHALGSHITVIDADAEGVPTMKAVQEVIEFRTKEKVQS